MGYKIEIVLICIALVLCGGITLAVALEDNTAPEILVEYNTNKTSTDKNVSSNIINQTTKKVNYSEQKSEKININTATKEQLMGLDGIGEVLSQRIIDYRKTRKFGSIEEIKNVYGIGDAKFEAIKNNIEV